MFRVLSINANGLRDANKRMSFAQWLIRLKIDFLCIQELHTTSCHECFTWFSPFGFECITSPGSARSCETALLYRPKFNAVKSSFNSDGRLASGVFSFDNVIFAISSVYAPNRNPDRNCFLQLVHDSVDPAIPSFLCGDLNTVFDRSLDRRGSNAADTSRESSTVLRSLFADCCVIDAWRHLHPGTPGFTWDSPDGSLSSRIDFIACPSSWSHLISSCDIVPCPYSDHSAVLLQVSPPSPFPRGPGRWKLNVSILTDDDFILSVKNFWRNWQLQKTSFSSLQRWWDRGKELLKGLAINFCTQKSQVVKSSRRIFNDLSSHLKCKIDQGVVSLMPIFDNVQNKLKQLDLIAAEGAKVRSRVRWAEEGESSSKFFLRLERKRGSADWISAMQKADGSLSTDISGICDSWVSFYSNLFTASQVDLDVQGDLLNNLSLRLTPDQSDICDGHLSVREAHEALVGMQKGKSPGSDGLPVEFFLAFWDTLGGDLVEVLNASFESGLLPLSQRQALITLIFKKGDRTLHKNWRPISLLNVDYKICAKALAGRLLKVLHYVIHRDQTCGVKGRFIGDNVAFLRDVITYTHETSTPAVILSLDQEKAFDRVDWDFLESTLDHMGFGYSFISWFRLLYSDIRSAVLVNGYHSDFFKPSRGVRQGCPLSPLLYVISIEVLAANLRAHPDIIGLSVPFSPDPLSVSSLYADDTSVVVSSDEGITAVFDTYSRFETGTGAKLNLEKCFGLWLGPWISRTSGPVAIEWSTEKIKVLGVVIGNVDVSYFNWKPRIEAVERCLNSWRCRHLSFQRKALIVNALALSRVWYVASFIPMPLWVDNELNSLIFNFFWSGKKDLVSRTVTIHSKSDGGFSVVSPRLKASALISQWVRRLFVSPGSWVSLLTFGYFDRFGVDP